MSKRHICFFVLLIVHCQLSIVNCLIAAEPKPVKYKTLLAEAKAAIKSGRNQAKAAQNLLAIVNCEDIKKDQRAEIYYMAEELERSINEGENRKNYLRQPYDTVKFFSTILNMYGHILRCDSLEMIPNEKGELRYKYRQHGRDLLLTYRPNLLNGGKFLLKRNKYAESYSYFDMFIESAKAPIFEYYTTIRKDTMLARAAYWATVAAYNDNKPHKALSHIDQAIEGADTTLRISLQEYKVRCYEVLKEDSLWFANLVEGARLYPHHDYFYLHLMDIYSERKQYADGLSLCDSMLVRVGERAIYHYGRSRMLLGLQDYDACIAASDEALRLDTAMTDAYYNKGVAYLNKAVAFAETACNDIRNPKCKRDRETLQSLYRSALAPMERVRQQLPADEKRWASPLYRIYLNLNMGKEFAEMEKILNAQ